MTITATTTPSTSASVRSEIVEALRLDLVGPSNDHNFACELLRESPTRWYLTGFLVSSEAPVAQRTDETANDEIDAVGEGENADDDNPPDRAAANRSFLPSSMGLSVLVDPDASKLEATVCWGDYVYEGKAEDEDKTDDSNSEETREKVIETSPTDSIIANAETKTRGYRRIPRQENVSIELPKTLLKPQEFLIPNSNGLFLVVTVRGVSRKAIGASRLPDGTRSVSVFLVNRRPPNEKQAYRAFAFQTELRLVSDNLFVSRPDLRASEEDSDWDDMVADLQYRDVCEYAVGHGVSTTTEKDTDGLCVAVKTTWIPLAEVEWVAPSIIPDAELKMEALGSLSSDVEATRMLSPLVNHYRNWITEQQQKYQGLDSQRMQTINSLIVEASSVATRIEEGIKLLSRPEVIEAFRIANRTMAKAARQREAVQRQIDPLMATAPQWRPFQLAFFLMTMRSIVDEKHSDRERVDLLFFPTGGGKTEAYLGLAAFTMVLRRLRNLGVRSAGVSVLMRYTLRLLTLDQLGRASALMCALELEREQDKAKLGEWPFEIGLWVGSAATPNRMGGRGYAGPGKEYTAYTKTTQFQRDERKPAPIPIENCPWCGEKFNRSSFRLIPSIDNPIDLRVLCGNYKCEFSGDRPLPILGVDEPIYRRLPAFLIATIDKFAALPWTGETGALFGLVDRHDNNGFYGPCNPNVGNPLDGGQLPPLDLIIQDELHLISGPLGTIAGVYETVIDALSSREVDGKNIRPKIIASTATVRRADTQIRALFERAEITVFPPPGPDRRDSFFAKTQPANQVPARMYVGVAAQGRSLKVILLRSALALLGAAQVIYDREGGKRNKLNVADPYMTLVGYFNSLRELGGSRRIIEDEVGSRLRQYSRRKRLEPNDNLFTDREINYEVLELTSRVPTNDVAAAKRKLSLRFHEKERVDVALATNMISVGLDIIRLGLMVVLGQPKTSAEYIQATSRVGRDQTRPGLILTLLNIHKPRDRSHYERFENYHASFYRGVEATSVTPFSPRALDRALPGALVGFCRLGRSEMTPPLGAMEILTSRGKLTALAERFAQRAMNHKTGLDPALAQRLRDNVLARVNSLLDDWLNIAVEFRQTGTRLKYQLGENETAQRLLYDFLDPEILQIQPIRRNFKANRSMRDVESSVELTVKNLNDWGERK